MKKKIVKVFSLIVILLVLVFILKNVFFNRNATIDIKQGSTIKEIAYSLKENGIISSTLIFRLKARTSDKSTKIQAGLHDLNSAMSFDEIMCELTNPARSGEHIEITIPEGFEFRQIVQRLEENGVIDKDKFCEEAEHGEFDFDFIKDIPERENRLEGYLFPDTYYIYPNMTEHDIIEKMLSRFNKEFNDEYKKRANEIGMSVDNVVTLASIVEREAKGDEDRKFVASVFHNRLNGKNGTRLLESCATVQYILKERKEVLSYEDTKIDSPYNTYRYTGLPKGPIASPGKASLEATLYPENTDYLFFKVKDGKHLFSSNYEEHLQK